MNERARYGKVSLPQPLIDRVESFVRRNPQAGFTSVTDFVKYATREVLDRYEQRGRKRI